MKRTSIGLGLLVTCALALGACGGSDELTGNGGNGDTATTAGGDGGGTGDTSAETIPEGVPGLSGDCRELYNAFIQGLAAVGGNSSGADVVNMFQALQDAVPDELKDDAGLMGEAYGQYSELLNKYDGDLSKATVEEIQQATSKLSSDQVSAASDNISAYFEATCPQG